jgi:hypothetical protein
LKEIGVGSLSQKEMLPTLSMGIYLMMVCDGSMMLIGQIPLSAIRPAQPFGMSSSVCRLHNFGGTGSETTIGLRVRAGEEK